MVVGEIVEAQGQSMDWFYKLDKKLQAELYRKQLEKPPRRRKS